MPSKTNRNKTAQAIRYDVSNADSTCWNKRAQPFNPLGTNYGNMPSCEQDAAPKLIPKTKRHKYVRIDNIEEKGRRFRSERENRGITSRDLSNKLGMRITVIRYFETAYQLLYAEPDYNALYQQCKEWGIEI
jgi:ribosome-binding protein aMBF1 (putative translation factor)